MNKITVLVEMPQAGLMERSVSLCAWLTCLWEASSPHQALPAWGCGDVGGGGSYLTGR